MIKRWLWLISSAALILALALGASGCASKTEAPPVAPHETVTLEIMCGAPAGTPPYIEALTLSQMLKEHHPWLRASLMEAPGGALPLKSEDYPPERKSNVLIWLVTSSDWGDLMEGLGPYPRKYTDIRHVFQAIGVVDFFYTYDSNIKSPQDMIGKKIATSMKGQGPTVVMEALLRDAWGIIDQVDISNIRTIDAKDHLVTGVADLVWVGPNPMAGGKFGEYSLPASLLQVVSARETYWIGCTQEDVDKINAAEPWNTKLVVVPKGAAGGGQPPEDVAGTWMASSVGCWDVADDEVIYELVKFLDEHAAEFTERTGGYEMGGQFMSSTIFATEAMTHPGAVRYYKEKGYKIGE